MAQGWRHTGAGAGSYKVLNPSAGKGLDQVERVGTPHEARFATKRQIRRLAIPLPEPGRYLLGKSGRLLLATESSQAIDKGQAIPGPVVHIGPTRCGKSSDALTALEQWIGPAIVVDAKQSMTTATLQQRRQLGDVMIFDPTGLNTAEYVAKWNPLDHCDTWTGAEQVARRLVDATDQKGTEAGRFWASQGVPVLAALMVLARNIDKCMPDVARWVISMDQATDDGPGEVATYAKALARQDSVDTELADKVVANLRGLWNADPRTKASYFITMRKAVEAWTRNEVAAITDETNVDFDWLRNGNNTLYVIASDHDHEALDPVIGAFLATVTDQAIVASNQNKYDGANDVLLLIDEAGNLQLPQLPKWSSMLAGLGIQLVTIWQTISQINTSYHEAASTILGNSRSLILYGGTTDPRTFELLDQLLGSDFHEGKLDRLDHEDSTSIHELPLVPSNALRSMPRDRRLLIQSDIPPIELRRIERFSKKWMQQREQLED